MTNFRVDIRDLKRNTSEVIRRAEAGHTISVLRNGKPTSVVIKTDDAAKKRWVSADQLRSELSEIGSDETGWLEQREHDRAVESVMRDERPL